ncbi:MAG: hypothetical protein EBR07_09870 [Planctomycetes bacterium]|nr:hypothetical protein [Planctomycetota bacterium]
MRTRPVQRLLILGWDAADWQIIDPLLARGQMPNLAALIAAGTRANLRTMEPKLRRYCGQPSPPVRLPTSTAS